MFEHVTHFGVWSVFAKKIMDWTVLGAPTIDTLNHVV